MTTSLYTNGMDLHRRQSSNSATRSSHPLSLNQYTAHDNMIELQQHSDNELLISLLSHKLHLIDVKRRHIPLITYPLLRLFLREDTKYISRGSDNTFFSYTEADSVDASLVLDVESLQIFQSEINALHYASHNSVIDQPNDLLKVVGPALRAIQICEGSSGLIGRSVISDVSTVLAKAGYSIFYVSTAAGDYVLVNDIQLNDIINCLNSNFKLLRDTKDQFDSPELIAIPHKSSKQQHDLQFNLSDVSSNGHSPALMSQSPNTHHKSMSKVKKPKPSRWDYDTISNSSDDHDTLTTHLMTEDISLLNHIHNNNKRSTIDPINGTAAMFSSLNLDVKRSTPPSTPPRHNTATPQESPTNPGRKLQLRILPHALSILSLNKRSLPSISHILLNTIFFPTTGLSTARFFSYTVIDDEISIICDINTYAALQLSLQGSSQISQYTHSNSNGHSALHIDRRNIVDQWHVIEAIGYYDINQVGLVSHLSQPLSDANINFFYFSTFRTGFVLIRNNDLEHALQALSTDFEVEKSLHSNIQSTQQHYGAM